MSAWTGSDPGPGRALARMHRERKFVNKTQALQGLIGVVVAISLAAWSGRVDVVTPVY